MPGTSLIKMKPYTTIRSGEIAGATVSTQMPDIPCEMIKFKAPITNTGKVYIGPNSGALTVADGGADSTTGLEINAGDDSGFILVDNANRLGYICTTTGDELTYLALAD